MPGSVAISALASVRTKEQSAVIPWYIYSLLIASACDGIGGLWDVSWHLSIGRDSFWTPPHLLIQFCAMLGAVTCSIVILKTTFGNDTFMRASSVNVLGFRGPLGVFVVMWGAAAMLISAPFDNWWHNAYGLDVKILSPPHALLGLGAACIHLGGMLLILGCMNRTDVYARSRFDWLFLFAAGVVLCDFMFFSIEYTITPFMHSAIFYRTVAIGVPFVMLAAAQASEKRWAATTVAGVYTVFFLVEGVILRQFAAEPRLGPVYNKVTHYVFPFFPLLIILPAISLDLLRPCVRTWSKWLQAVVMGIAFVAVMIAVQWPFGNFLMSPASRNWFFGSGDLAYGWPPESSVVRHVFLSYEPSRAAFAKGMAIALGYAILSARLGFGWGKWMRDVQR